MLVEILEFDRARQIVTFRTDWGTAQAGWSGDAPHPGDNVDIEIELGTLEWGSSIVPSPSASAAILQRNDQFVLQAVLERMDDNVAVLRLGTNLVLAEVSGPSMAGPGMPVCVTTSTVSLHPTNF